MAHQSTAISPFLHQGVMIAMAAQVTTIPTLYNRIDTQPWQSCRSVCNTAIGRAKELARAPYEAHKFHLASRIKRGIERMI